MPHSALENWEVLEIEQNKNKTEKPMRNLENKDFSCVMVGEKPYISQAIFHFLFKCSSYFKCINSYWLLFSKALQ